MKKLNFTSMADFKRKCVVGNYLNGSYYGKKYDEPWRKITAVQSNGVYLLTKMNGKETGSFFEFPKAGSCKIVDGVLKIYEERAIFKSNGNDVFAKNLKWDLENGYLKEDEIKRYSKQVAEYQLGTE